MKSKTILLGRRDIDELLTMREALQVVEDAFRFQALDKVIMPPKIYLELPQYHGDFRAMPAYINDIAGLKWVSAYPENHYYHLPNVLATIILCDPETGYPVAIMDGTQITSIRTGAAGGVAVKYLAREGSATIGIVGAGMQAETQLLAVTEVLSCIEKVKVFDKYENVSRRYTKEMGNKFSLTIEPVKVVQEAANADIVITTTPSVKPIVGTSDIRPGTHINAIGADAPGKQELESNLLSIAKIVVDNLEQTSHAGEINVPLAEGSLRTEDVHSTLGEVIVGMKKGRENRNDITIFDSTGLAIQDIACAKLVFEKARKRDVLNFDLCAI